MEAPALRLEGLRCCPPDAGFHSSSLPGVNAPRPPEVLLDWPDSWYGPVHIAHSQDSMDGSDSAVVSWPEEIDAEDEGADIFAYQTGQVGFHCSGGEFEVDDTETGSELEIDTVGFPCSGGTISPASLDAEVSIDKGAIITERARQPEAQLLGGEMEQGSEEGECPPWAISGGFVGGCDPLQTAASCPPSFVALVSTRASQCAELQRRPISAVVSDWRIKCHWDLVLDKISELNKRCACRQGGKNVGHKGGVIAQWWKGMRKMGSGGGEDTWQELRSGSWEVW